MTSMPPIEELLPHRGTMLLLDRLVGFSDHEVEAEYAPRRDGWYADGDGNMPAWFGIELMAQAAAVCVAVQKRKSGLPVKMGALLGTRSYQSEVKSFAADEILRILAKETLRYEDGIAIYDCSILMNGKKLATSTLKAYEPEDFDAFIRKDPA